ncbi:MAG: GTP-binding protein [Candidatus Lokiarchaeota archaeon]|nr:GTP-binding protein [Candidatus Lokiarchaeota archaeon]
MDKSLIEKLNQLEKENKFLKDKIGELQNDLLQFMSKDENIEEKINYYKLKLVVLGENRVGKTSFIKQFAFKEFDKEYKPTLGAEITKMKLRFKNDIIDLIIWDIAGQIAYKNLSKTFLQDADLVILMYDITRPITFENTKNWFDIATKVLENKFASILVGNKSDLEDQRKIFTKNALEFAQSIEIPFIETSTKENWNIKDVLIILIADFLQVNLV